MTKPCLMLLAVLWTCRRHCHDHWDHWITGSLGVSQKSCRHPLRSRPATRQERTRTSTTHISPTTLVCDESSPVSLQVVRLFTSSINTTMRLLSALMAFAPPRRQMRWIVMLLVCTAALFLLSEQRVSGRQAKHVLTSTATPHQSIRRQLGLGRLSRRCSRAQRTRS